MECKEIERSIIKKYKSKIFGRFLKGVKEFELIKDGDKIAVCISGGKDSFVLAKCMQELKRHSKIVLIWSSLSWILVMPRKT